MQDILQQVAQALVQYMPDSAWGWVMLTFNVVTAVMAVAAALVKLLAVVAKITPSTKDDELATKAQVFLGTVSHVLDKISLGLTAEQARRSATKPSA